MEQEALRRAREMHSHTPKLQRNERAERPVPPTPQSQRETPQKKPERESQKNAPSGTGLDSLFADKEKLLILSLILILSSEERNDPSLTLALLYLII